MKKTALFILCIIIGALLISAPAAAQSCIGSLYQYSDMWVDENGNIVADNFTDADPCGDYSAYATVTISMPSGSSYYASGSGYSSFAEALAQAATSNESGNGEVDGFSEVDYACGSQLFGSFISDFGFGSSVSFGDYAFYAPIGPDVVSCNYVTQPICPVRCKPSTSHYITATAAQCLSHSRTDWLFLYWAGGTLYSCAPNISYVGVLTVMVPNAGPCFDIP